MLHSAPGTSLAPLPARVIPVRERGDARRTLATLRHGSILDALNAALAFRNAGRLDSHTVESLGSDVERGNGTARVLALHALARQHDERTRRRLVEALTSSDRGVREHAAWVLGDQPPDPAALPALIGILDDGGFGGMLAQLTLERWGASDTGRVAGSLETALERADDPDRAERYVETLGLLAHGSAAVPTSIGHTERRGEPASRLRLAQVMLQGRLDRGLTGAGAGDGGGLATLVVSLAQALGSHPSVTDVVTFTRGFTDPSRPGMYSARREGLGTRSSLERLSFGPDRYLATSEQWPHRVEIEWELTRALRRIGQFDAAHLRFADVGTFAAARVFRRHGVPIVFTLAPDPHAVLREAEAAGELSRDTFAAADLEHHYVFRARLVDWMLQHADALALLPRPDGESDFHALLGTRFREVPRRRLHTIPEGIATTRRPTGRAADPSDVDDALQRAVEALPPSRHGLPLIVTVSRLHRIKGIPQLVDAWSGDSKLSAGFNLLVVGGGLERPTAEEQFVLDEIDNVCRHRPSARDGLVLLGHRPNPDVSRLLDVAADGIPGVIAPGGVYACASRKEEFGLALLEALAAGLSAVGPNTGGPPTYIDEGRTGFLTDTTTVAGLRDGLHRAAAGRLDAARAARARRLVSERFTVTAMADALVSLYEEVAGVGELEAA